MPKELVISAAPHETRVAILEDGLLCEIYIEREKEFALVGSIYKGRVTRVLPGMQSAFVDIGLDSDAFLYVGDFLENLEDYDHVITAVEGKVEKMEQQGGVVFPAAGAGEVSAPDASPQDAPSEEAAPHEAAPQDAALDQPGSETSVDDPQFAENDSPSETFGNRAPAAGSQHADPRHASQQNRSQGRPAFPPSSPSSTTPFVRQDRGPRGDQGQGYRQGQGQQGQGSQGSQGSQGQGSGAGRGQNDRGSRQRGGKFRRGRGNDRRPGRDLPPSKYAAPRAFTPAPRPYEPPTEEPPADFTPVILPGESLAKYKGRLPASAFATPSAQAAPPVHSDTESLDASVNAAAIAGENAGPLSPESPLPSAAADHSVAGQIPGPEADAAAKAAAPILPSALYAQTEHTDAEHKDSAPAAPSAHETSAAGESHAHAGTSATFGGQRHEHDDAPGTPGTGAELTDDEVTVLAEQLAEARQEEATAKTEAAALVPETDLAGLAHDELHDDLEEEQFASEHAFDDVRATPLPGTSAEADEGAAGSGEHDTSEHDDSEHDEQHVDETALISASDVITESESDLDHPESAAAEIHEHDDAAAPASSAPPASQRPMSARVSDPQRARFQRPMRRGGRQPQRSGGPRQGGRPQDHRQQPARRPQLISEMLKTGQEIIVQIAKEPLGKKGARITSHVALPGRFLVYMPTVNHVGVSRRIGSAEERSRLRRVVTEAKGSFPGGFIVRTAAEGAPEDEIRSDVEFLGRTWDKIRTQSEPRKSPALLHRDLNLVERILRDYVSNDYTAIWIDNEEEFSKVVDFVSRFQPKLVSRVKLYTKPAPIFEEFGIQQELDKALRPKVWLKSGGYIVINHTEALVAIDVNTGKYVGRGSTRLEDTIVKTNLEAVKEIIRQIRLRDLGGIIVLDFIDMEERRNRDKVMAALDGALRSDRAPSKALPFNEFGLVCVTRKRTKQALERVLCQPCPYCTGSGMVKSVPTICYEIQAEARKMAVDLDATSLTLRVHPEIAKALKTREAALIEELEQNTRKSIIIQADPTLHWEQYDIY